MNYYTHGAYPQGFYHKENKKENKKVIFCKLSTVNMGRVSKNTQKCETADSVSTRVVFFFLFIYLLLLLLFIIIDKSNNVKNK